MASNGLLRLMGRSNGVAYGGSIRAVIALLLLIAASTTSLADNDEIKWGDVPLWMASLLWAEKNCPGSASPGARELRLYLRKHFPSEFGEATIAFENEVKNEARDGGEASAISVACMGVERNFGPKGWNIPDFWFPTKARAVPSPAGAPVNDFAWGDLIEWASDVQLAQARCEGVPTTLGLQLARGLATVFRTSELYKSNINWDAPGACSYLRRKHDKTSMLPQLMMFSTGVSPEIAEHPVESQSATSSFVHGRLISQLNGEGVAPLRINTSPGTNYFFKLTNTITNEVLSGFIVGGRPLETLVPLGSYELKYAYGDVWLNETDYFGEKTYFAIAKAVLDFRATNEGYSGVSVTLILTPDGNLKTGYLSKAEF